MGDDTLPRCPITGKVCYTEAEAKAARRGLQASRIGKFSKYRCESAHLHPDKPWHVGHTIGRRNPKRNKRRPIIGPIGE